jgi:hypothetical protein
MESAKLAEPRVRLQPKNIYLVCRGDHWSSDARQKVTFTPMRANTVRPYGNDGISVIGAHTVTISNLLSAFSFDSKGAKEKANKKKTPKGEFRSLRRATDVSSSAHDKLLKKFDQNFQMTHPIPTPTGKFFASFFQKRREKL